VTGDECAARWLRDLRQIGEQAAYLVAYGQDRYLADSPEGALLRNAGERILIKVATVVERLPSEFKSARPDVAWDKIMRMRNLVAHHYDHVDDDLLWAALSRRIPALIDRLDGSTAAVSVSAGSARRLAELSGSDPTATAGRPA